jgi:hypothetical protein
MMNMRIGYFGAAALLAAMAAFAAPGAAQRSSDRNGVEAAEDRLNDVINNAIHADGPFFNAQERALVERKCGYAPGSWNGLSFNMSDGVLHCTNGRRVDDAEVRAMMEVAGPRISARVDAALARPEVAAAIEATAERAAARALREVREEFARPAQRR